MKTSEFKQRIAEYNRDEMQYNKYRVCSDNDEVIVKINENSAFVDANHTESYFVVAKISSKTADCFTLNPADDGNRWPISDELFGLIKEYAATMPEFRKDDDCEYKEKIDSLEAKVNSLSTENAKLSSNTCGLNSYAWSPYPFCDLCSDSLTITESLNLSRLAADMDIIKSKKPNWFKGSVFDD